MPMLMNCPKCAFQMDIAGIPAGTPASCPNCGSPLNIPRTQVFRAVGPASRPRAAGTGTGLRKSAPRAGPPVGPKSNTNVIVGVAVAGVVALGVAGFLLLGGGGKKPRPKSEGTVQEKPETESGKTSLPPKEPEVSKGEKKEEESPLPPSGGDAPPPFEKDVKTQKIETPEQGKADEPKGAAEVAQAPPPEDPNAFKPGARELALKMKNFKFPEMPADKKQRADNWIERHSTQSLLDNIHYTFWRVLERALDDDEKTARYCFEVLEQMSVKLGMEDASTKQVGFKTDWVQFPDPAVRLGMVVAFIGFMREGGQEVLNSLKPVEEKQDLSRLNWDKIVSQLQHFSVVAEGNTAKKFGYVKSEDPDVMGPYEWVEKLRELGRDAYPYLIRYVDHENVKWAQGACVALRQLTDYAIDLPRNPEEGKEIQKKWLERLGIGEAELPR